MILSEEHRIKKHNNKKLLHEIDDYCYKVKNLSNSVNYLIKQCYRIHKKIVNGKALEDWEKELIQEINTALAEYNEGRSENKQLRYIGADNGYIADAYFLSWYLKGTEVYKTFRMQHAARYAYRRNAESGSRSTGRQQNMGKIRRSLRNIPMYRGISTQKQEEVLL